MVCEQAGYVLDGHFACSREGIDTELLELSNGVDEVQSEFDGNSWRLLAFARSSAAAERGWALAA